MFQFQYNVISNYSLGQCQVYYVMCTICHLYYAMCTMSCVLYHMYYAMCTMSRVLYYV